MTNKTKKPKKANRQKSNLRELTREEVDAVTGGPGGQNAGHGFP